jgi:mRNA interferase MazF
MKRGEIWTVAGSSTYLGKPRPAVIIQDDQFEVTNSVTLCPFTTDLLEASFARLAVIPTEANGLSQPSKLMADKITTVPRARLGYLCGRLDDEDVLRLNRAVLVFLSLTGSSAGPAA